MRRIYAAARRNKAGAIAGVVVVALGAGGLAIAADPAEQVNGCVHQTTGALRIVDADAACRSTETAISFARQGPEGPTGPQGEKGDKGDTGPAGQDARAALKANQFQVGTARIFRGTTPVYTFDIYGFSQGYSNAGSSFGGGSGGAGKVNVSDASFTKRFTPETTRLWVELATGRHFDKVEVVLDDATFTYEDASLTSAQHALDDGGRLENISLVSARQSATFGSDPVTHSGGTLALGSASTGFDSFSWGATMAAAPIGGGGGTGKVNPADLSLSGFSDSASTLLLRSVMTGQHIQTAQAVVSPAPEHTYKMDDVMVSSLQFSVAGTEADERLRRTLSLNFRKLQQTQAGTNEKGEWDFAATTAG